MSQVLKKPASVSGNLIPLFTSPVSLNRTTPPVSEMFHFIMRKNRWENGRFGDECFLFIIITLFCFYTSYSPILKQELQTAPALFWWQETVMRRPFCCCKTKPQLMVIRILYPASLLLWTTGTVRAWMELSCPHCELSCGLAGVWKSRRALVKMPVYRSLKAFPLRVSLGF